jgi:hypothetical protein
LDEEDEFDEDDEDEEDDSEDGDDDDEESEEEVCVSNFFFSMAFAIPLPLRDIFLLCNTGGFIQAEARCCRV